jgi:hypothetical protein
VDGEVRELIRRRELDPFTDPGLVRLLVRDVVVDYSERSLTSALPPIDDAESVVRDVLDRVAGFGPLQRYLDDPEVEEIWVNEPGRVFIARRGRSELTTTILAPGELADLVERMLRTSGRRIDMSTPFVDATMPDGSRLHVVIPDIIPTAWLTCVDTSGRGPDLGERRLPGLVVVGPRRTSCGLFADRRPLALGLPGSQPAQRPVDADNRCLLERPPRAARTCPSWGRLALARSSRSSATAETSA